MTADFVPGASIPGSMREEIGGGAFNAVRVAVRCGAATTLMSMRGGDGAGLRVAEAIAADGIADASAVFLDRATPSYTALLDRHGDVVAALADMGLYDLAFPKQLRRAKIREEMTRSDAVLTDANLPESALRRLATAAGPLPIFAIAISPAKAVRLMEILPSLACLFMNRREASALAGLAANASGPADPATLAGTLTSLGLKRAVITNGGDATVALDGGRRWCIVPPAPRRIADVTGAGDAIAGAATVALLRGLPFPEAIREGMAAALLAVETASAVPAFTAAEFAAALALVPLPVEMA